MTCRLSGRLNIDKFDSQNPSKGFAGPSSLETSQTRFEHYTGKNFSLILFCNSSCGCIECRELTVVTVIQTVADTIVMMAPWRQQQLKTER